MPNILIIGATGYLGLNLASTLTRSGCHTVYGLARTPSKAQLLLQNEIIPISGSVTDSANYLSTITSANISIIVDASGAGPESRTILQDLKKLATAHAATASSAGIKAPRLGFIYVSGTWVHGSSNEPINDLCPVGVASSPTQPPPLVAWRPALEQEVLASPDLLDVAVLRPALIYGRAGAIWSSLFQSLSEASKTGTHSVDIPLAPKSRPGLVHVDDVASALACLANRLPLLAGTNVHPVFDIVTSQESMRDVMEGAATVLGFDGEVNLVGPGDNGFMEAMGTTFKGSSARARQLLGWEPKRLDGMVAGIKVFVRSWEAAQ